jgi:acetyltransferase-like isoleucine patch superfamily enzyme
MHVANMVGLTTPILLESIGEGTITIGNHSGVSSVVISARSRVQIGKFVKLGGNVRIYDHDYHSLNAKVRRDPARDGKECRTAPVIIGDDVFIGTNSIVLKGVTIGERSVVGAGSVVVCDVPSDEIWAGNPAKFIKATGEKCE